MAKLLARRIVFPEKSLVRLEEFELEGPGPRQILTQTISSLISVGTELVGLHAKYLRKNHFPSYPGYSNISEIIEVGEEVEGFSPGERVFSQAGHATHTLLDVDKQIILKVPEALPSSYAAFTCLGAVALYGIREANISLENPWLSSARGL